MTKVQLLRHMHTSLCCCSFSLSQSLHHFLMPKLPSRHIPSIYKKCPDCPSFSHHLTSLRTITCLCPQTSCQFLILAILPSSFSNLFSGCGNLKPGFSHLPVWTSTLDFLVSPLSEASCYLARIIFFFCNQWKMHAGCCYAPICVLNLHLRMDFPMVLPPTVLFLLQPVTWCSHHLNIFNVQYESWEQHINLFFQCVYEQVAWSCWYLSVAPVWGPLFAHNPVTFWISFLQCWAVLTLVQLICQMASPHLLEPD